MPNKPAAPLKNVRVPDDLWNSAKAVAKSEGRSLSEVIRQMLAMYVEKGLDPGGKAGL
ncbi:ribbon-helix-helix domain-containing protein [Kitasatospora sp. MBT66]|uniref:ribbon-helix-helix domain-containing protein n=1 Tax=Kitasatospora sp. MBT66 TaxID=1444769 RepID=UPI00131453F6|nr:ribbon-helix-helix domain-containing protein [Kitasatospora sp. MBT66]